MSRCVSSLYHTKAYHSYSNQSLEADPRVTVLNLDGYEWDAYRTIEEQGLLKDVVKQDWNAGSMFMPLSPLILPVISL